MRCAACNAWTLVCMMSQNAASSRRSRDSRQAPAPMSVTPGQVMLSEMPKWSPGHPTVCPMEAAHGMTDLRTPS